MMQIKLAILVAAIAGALLVGFGAGWAINGWRLGTEVATLKGTVDTQKQSLETLEGANKRCTAGVADVKQAVQAIADDGAARTKAAAVAMAEAANQSKAHLAAAKDALNRPLPASGKECEALMREAAEYAKKRKGTP